jgi:glutaminase
MALLDFKRVTSADLTATRLLADLIARCAQREQHVVLTRVRRGDLLAGLDAELHPRAVSALTFHPQLDLGLEWCEQALLKWKGLPQAHATAVTLAEHALFAGLSPDELALITSLVTRAQFEPGATVVQRGDPADGLYLLLRGQVSVVVDLPSGGLKRLSTLTPGMSFGELAMLSGGRRSATVRADTGVDCARLDAPSFERLEREHPALAIRLLRNVLQVAAATAVQLTAEVAALEG